MPRGWNSWSAASTALGTWQQDGPGTCPARRATWRARETFRARCGQAAASAAGTAGTAAAAQIGGGREGEVQPAGSRAWAAPPASARPPRAPASALAPPLQSLRSGALGGESAGGCRARARTGAHVRRPAAPSLRLPAAVAASPGGARRRGGPWARGPHGPGSDAAAAGTGRGVTYGDFPREELRAGIGGLRTAAGWQVPRSGRSSPPLSASSAPRYKLTRQIQMGPWFNVSQLFPY